MENEERMADTNDAANGYSQEEWNAVYNQNKSPFWRDDGRDKYFTEDICAKFQIKQSDTVLEYGCDRGIIGAFFLQHGMKVDFAEIADIPIAELNRHFGDKSRIFQVSEPKEIDKKYDLIICSCVIHHLPPQQKRDFIRQFYDRLNDGGKLWISAIASDDHTVIKADGNFSTAQHKPYLIDEQTIEDMTKDSGFEISDTRKISFKINNFDRAVVYHIICLNKTSKNKPLKEKTPDITFEDEVIYADEKLENVRKKRKEQQVKDPLEAKQTAIENELRAQKISLEDMGKTGTPGKKVSKKEKVIAWAQIKAVRDLGK